MSSPDYKGIRRDGKTRKASDKYSDYDFTPRPVDARKEDYKRKKLRITDIELDDDE